MGVLTRTCPGTLNEQRVSSYLQLSSVQRSKYKEETDVYVSKDSTVACKESRYLIGRYIFTEKSYT